MQTDGSLGGLKDELGNLFDFQKIIEGIQEAASNLSAYSTELNKTFGQTRVRIVEIQTAIADAVPQITRLGGGVDDVLRTMQGAAEGMRRNIVLTTEQTEKLFAASRILGTDAKYLVDSFTDVGIGIQNIPDQLESSLEYIRSIGGNSQQIFKVVQESMDQLNRYQFEGGVQGLTKMAAQATMLRFDMNETFRLAENLYKPERAVEVAAAFQRLGVSVGNLVDPFQLMNQSINDPQGLQNSLANVAKQFTYFDEQTKSFKINPQGVLTLREMESQTGVSAREMSKMALAAADLDRRITAINTAGLKIATEEDKQFLANILSVESDGTYRVTLEDGTKKELAELTQPEFDKLIEEQKKGPKSLEEIQRNQMNLTQVLTNDVKAIKEKILYGIVSPREFLQGMEGARRLTTTTTGELSRMGTTEDVRKFTTDIYNSIKDLIKDLKTGDVKPNIAIADLFDKVQSIIDRTGQSLAKGLTQTGSRISQGITTKTTGEAFLKDKLNELLGQVSSMGLTKEVNIQPQKLSSLMYGEKGIDQSLLSGLGQGGMKISWDGPNPKLDVNINNTNPNAAPFTQEQMTTLTKALTDKFNEMGFKDWVINVSSQQNPTKAPKAATYGK